MGEDDIRGPGIGLHDVLLLVGDNLLLGALGLDLRREGIVREVRSGELVDLGTPWRPCAFGKLHLKISTRIIWYIRQRREHTQ